jgi:tetratricopeptide (TPR) repeat protein
LLQGTRPDFGLLEARDFIRRGSGSSLDGDREYAFKHTVTREVAYASVPKRRRARLHADFATWLERTGGGRDEHAPLLAHHYASAMRPEDSDFAWQGKPETAAELTAKAALWLQRAGELAITRYDLDEAITLLHQATVFEKDDAKRAELWREIGRANALGFHGDEFLDSMQRSLELSGDPGARGATYAELAYQTSFRAGMWPRAPDPDDVSAWIEQGLALTGRATAGRCKALIARSFWSATGEVAAAQEAVSIASGLGDPDLLAAAYAAEARVTHRDGRHADALALAERQLELVPELRDPEQVIEVYEALVPIQAMLGRFDEAREITALQGEATQRLTAHHRVHGVALRAELEELSADWKVIRDLTPRIERTVADNLQTPCIRNQRTLLVSALAHRALGEVAEAERLEQAAESLAMEGYDLHLSGPRLRLALLKGDNDALQRHVDAGTAAVSRDLYWLSFSGTVARLDALVELGDRDRAEAEAEPLLAHRGTYVEPFALRALGRMNGDASLISRALERFRALGLAWHAEQTVLASRR